MSDSRIDRRVTFAEPSPGGRLARLRASRLVRQNVILFAGGLVAGIGGFVYHAIAGRVLGPVSYGDVASLIALYAVLMTPTYILIIVLARYAAQIGRDGGGSVRYLILRSTQVTLLPSILIVVIGALLAGVVADFLHLRSPNSVIWLMAAVAVIWQVAIPRGILQGLQSFGWLSANLSMEMVVRCSSLGVLLFVGGRVSGAAAAVLGGAIFAYALGMWSLRDHVREPGERTPLRSMLGFSLTAATGTLGILLLYNLDVILAKHFLPAHEAGIYGGLNKIGTILYFLTLSVSQVLFPRVVEALSANNHPGRLLGASALLMLGLGAGSLLVFWAVPGLIVRLLFGPAFADATPYIFAVGMIGLALSLDNLLVQFFMAAHDRWFMPLLAGGVVMLGVLIAVFHGGVTQVVIDVLASLLLLLGALSARLFLLLPKLTAEEPAVVPAA